MPISNLGAEIEPLTNYRVKHSNTKHLVNIGPIRHDYKEQF